MSDVVVLDGRASREPARRAGMRRVLTDIGLFGEALFDLPLREYQLRVARAVLDSVARRRGLTITVLMPRQAGKNELQAARLRPSMCVRRLS